MFQCGLGICSFSSLKAIELKKMISISIGRSLYSVPLDFSTRPNCRSTSCRHSNNSRGAKVVETFTQTLQKSFGEANPSGLE